jgi:hypothetical protein
MYSARARASARQDDASGARTLLCGARRTDFELKDRDVRALARRHASRGNVTADVRGFCQSQ